MTCSREQRGPDVWFICGDLSAREKAPRCSVCNGRNATLLCDGPREDDPGKTCDAPIHRRCSVRAMTGSRWERVELFANRIIREQNKHVATKDKAGQTRPLFKPEADTVDFCPKCAERYTARENERRSRGDGASFVRLEGGRRRG